MCNADQNWLNQLSPWCAKGTLWTFCFLPFPSYSWKNRFYWFAGAPSEKKIVSVGKSEPILYQWSINAFRISQTTSEAFALQIGLEFEFRRLAAGFVTNRSWLPPRMFMVIRNSHSFWRHFVDTPQPSLTVFEVFTANQWYYMYCIRGI